MCTLLYRSYQPLSSQHYDVAEQLCSNKLRSKMAKKQWTFQRFNETYQYKQWE